MPTHPRHRSKSAPHSRVLRRPNNNGALQQFHSALLSQVHSTRKQPSTVRYLHKGADLRLDVALPRILRTTSSENR